MAKKELVIVVNYPEESSFDLQELCKLCGTSADFIHALIEYEIIHQDSIAPDEWAFDLAHLQRVKRAMRLTHDLQVNLPGVAVILDLLDEMEELREKVDLFERHFLK